MDTVPVLVVYLESGSVLLGSLIEDTLGAGWCSKISTSSYSVHKLYEHIDMYQIESQWVNVILCTQYIY